MQFCLIRDTDGADTQNVDQHRGVILNVRELTVGMATSQHLQLTAAGVDPVHALISRQGRNLRLKSISPAGVRVNGRRKLNTAVLRSGDVLQIGEATIHIHPPRADGSVVLQIVEPAGEDEDEHSSWHRAAPQDSGLPMRFWSWSLVLAVLALFLFIPLGGLMMPAAGKVLRDVRFLPSDGSWSPGPLHSAHQPIGTDCNACHLLPFERVKDEQCGKCHGDVQHHVDIHTDDVTLFKGERCEPCHREHKQPAALVQTDPRLCTDCHGGLERLKAATRVQDVSDFSTRHPEFHLSVLASTDTGQWQTVRLDRSDPTTFVEHSHLRFSHAQHLNPKGVKSPEGERVLKCQDCHRPDASGRQMQPIRMQTQCAGCHSLRFDENDPGSGVPHGNLDGVIKTVREHFSRLYLELSGSAASDDADANLRRPGGQLVARGNQLLRARQYVDEHSLKIVRELLEKRVCVDCHEITHLRDKTGFDQWRVEPVRLTTDWMPHARFDHAAHISQECVSCHTQAANSKKATDILIPTISECRACHGGANEPTKIRSDCLMCHQFHLPGRGRMLQVSVPGSSTPVEARHPLLSPKDAAPAPQRTSSVGTAMERR